MAENSHINTELRWKEFIGTDLDRIIEPRATKMLPCIHDSGRKLLMGIAFTKRDDGKWIGDCHAYWKAVRA